jgi:sulfur carrier protein
MTLLLNGKPREFPSLAVGADLQQLVDALQLKGDRIAVELNGSIVPRKDWPQTTLAEHDKLEVVHFVGGGCVALPEAGHGFNRATKARKERGFSR